MEKELSENIIATFIDQKQTPLEEIIYSKELKEKEYSEVLELVKETQDNKHLIEKLPITEIPECLDYINKITEFKDLKNNLDFKKPDLL